MTNETVLLCDDCTIVAVNDDASGIGSDERVAAVYAGIERIGWVTPTDDTIEFTARPCGCCGTRLAGSRTAFLVA